MKLSNVEFTVLVLVCILFAGALFASSMGFGSISRIMVDSPITVYSDDSMSTVLERIDWGECYRGEAKSFSFWVRNEGDSAVLLNLSTVNWVPVIAGDYLVVSWDYDGHGVVVNGSVSVVLSLFVGLDVRDVDSFSMDVVITASAV